MNTPVLVIGNKAYSSWSLRPWLLMRHFGVDFEEVRLALNTPDFDQRIGALSPTRRVPALKHGEVHVWDSLAIAEYVNEAWLGGRGWPRAAAERALARAVTAEMHSGFTALRGECPMNVRRQFTPRPLSAETQRDVARILDLWRELRARFAGAGDFLFGEFGIADAFYAPVVTRFRTYGVTLDGAARDYADAIFALPAMRRWLDEAAAESEVLAKYERADA